MRLNKFLSKCGITSRRAADELIAAGRVSINGEVATQLGAVIDESRDEIAVDGKRCQMLEQLTYIVLYKPADVLVTLKDDFGRRTIKSLIRDLPQRVYPVGRLDYDSEGVLLLTDDGEFAFRLTHPRWGVTKIYLVTVEGRFERKLLQKFKQGIRLEDGYLATAEAALVRVGGDHSVLSLTLSEGRKREIKQMCKTLGHPVRKILRLDFGGITLDGISPGRWRHLTTQEVAGLQRKVALRQGKKV